MNKNAQQRNLYELLTCTTIRYSLLRLCTTYIIIYISFISSGCLVINGRYCQNVIHFINFRNPNLVNKTCQHGWFSRVAKNAHAKWVKEWSVHWLLYNLWHIKETACKFICFLINVHVKFVVAFSPANVCVCDAFYLLRRTHNSLLFLLSQPLPSTAWSDVCVALMVPCNFQSHTRTRTRTWIENETQW